MPLPELKGTLTDIGTEELNHLEMIGAIVYQLTKDLTEDEIKEQGGNPLMAEAPQPSSAEEMPMEHSS